MVSFFSEATNYNNTGVGLKYLTLIRHDTVFVNQVFLTYRLLNSFMVIITKPYNMVVP